MEEMVVIYDCTNHFLHNQEKQTNVVATNMLVETSCCMRFGTVSFNSGMDCNLSIVRGNTNSRSVSDAVMLFISAEHCMRVVHFIIFSTITIDKV